MIRPGKIQAVAVFEFLSTVRRKGYLFATFGMPLILLAYGALVSGAGQLFRSQAASSERAYGVVDSSGLLGLDAELRRSRLPEAVLDAIESSGRSSPVSQIGTAILRPYEDPAAAHAELLAGAVAGYFLIPEDYLRSGRLEQFVPDRLDLNVGDARDAIAELLAERLMQQHLDPGIAERVRDPVAQLVSWTVLEDGSTVSRSPLAAIARLIVPLVFAMLLFVAILMNTNYLVQGVAVEKENKVAEVLLSSANPDEILAGKLLGLGAAGLLQVAVWYSMLLAAAMLLAGLLAALGIGVPWLLMLVALPFFGAGYLFYGALMLATGSIGSTYKEAQQFSAIWGLLAAAPMFFLPMILHDPGSTAARALTWFPFSTPVTVMLRVALEPTSIPAWEIAGSLLLLLASIWVALLLGGRLFRVGLLLGGSRPKLREILRQARRAA